MACGSCTAYEQRESIEHEDTLVLALGISIASGKEGLTDHQVAAAAAARRPCQQHSRGILYDDPDSASMWMHDVGHEQSALFSRSVLLLLLLLLLLLQLGDVKGKIYTHCGTNPGMQKLSLRSGGQTVSSRGSC